MMKLYFTAFIAALLLSGAQTARAQDVEAPERGQNERDQNEREPKESNSNWDYQLKKKKGFDRVEIGYNFFEGDDADNFTTTAEGLGSIKINLLTVYRYYAGPVYISPGWGLAISEFRFEDNLIFRHDADADALNVFEDPNPANDYGKSKLQLGYIRVPLELGLQARKFNLAFGGYADLLLWSKHKRKFRNDETQDFAKIILGGSDDLQLETFQFGVFGRVALGSVGLYVNYNLTNTFQDSGPDMRAVQVGLSLSRPFEKKGKSGGILKNLPIPPTKKI